MINWNLLTLRNVLVITAIAVIAHVIVSPVYDAIGGKTDDN